VTPTPVTPALTLEEIERLEDNTELSEREQGALLSMARRLVELESAMLFIAWHVGAARHWDECDTIDDIIALATRYGWSPAKVEVR
jgi:hypothetical protein